MLKIGRCRIGVCDVEPNSSTVLKLCGWIVERDFDIWQSLFPQKTWNGICCRALAVEMFTSTRTISYSGLLRILSFAFFSPLTSILILFPLSLRPTHLFLLRLVYPAAKLYWASNQKRFWYTALDGERETADWDFFSWTWTNLAFLASWF